MCIKKDEVSKRETVHRINIRFVESNLLLTVGWFSRHFIHSVRDNQPFFALPRDEQTTTYTLG